MILLHHIISYTSHSLVLFKAFLARLVKFGDFLCLPLTWTLRNGIQKKFLRNPDEALTSYAVKLLAY